MGYYDIYYKRARRFGDTIQDRIINTRKHEFDSQLSQSVYRVFFEFQGTQEGEFVRYKQDETETLHYLLTRTELNIPNGTILMIPDKDNISRPWLVYYYEHIHASGYNRYIMLRMSHFIKWRDRNGNIQSSWCYMYGQEDNMLKDEIKSRSRMDTIYTENLKMSFLVMPINPYILKDDYIEIGEGLLKEGYRVTGYDRQSSEGVEYITIDPVPLRDLTPAPQQEDSDNPNDFFWIKGGEQ